MILHINQVYTNKHHVIPQRLLTDSILCTNKNDFCLLLIYSPSHELLPLSASLQTELAVAGTSRTSWPLQQWAGGKKCSNHANASQVSPATNLPTGLALNMQLKWSRGTFLSLKVTLFTHNRGTCRTESTIFSYKLNLEWAGLFQWVGFFVLFVSCCCFSENVDSSKTKLLTGFPSLVYWKILEKIFFWKKNNHVNRI